MTSVADSGQFDQHTPALFSAGVAASDWSAAGKNADEIRLLDQIAFDIENLHFDPVRALPKLAGRLEKAYPKFGPIPTAYHIQITDRLSKVRGYGVAKEAFWNVVLRLCEGWTPAGQGKPHARGETPCTPDSANNPMQGLSTDISHYGQSGGPRYEPAHKICSWLSLQNHINTERNPLIAHERHLSQFDGWIQHGAKYGMGTVRWHEIDWPGKAENAPEAPQTGYLAKCDANTGALVIALYLASIYRIYLLFREWDTAENCGRGDLTRKQVKAAFRASGYQVTARHRRRILERGDGLFWGRGQRGIVHLRRPEKVAAVLVEQASAEGLPVCELPGNRRPVHVDISQTHEAFEAQLYAAVITAHGGDWLASRDLQSRIFNRSDDTIRKWERDRLPDTVTVTPCEAVADEDYNGPVPDHAYLKGGHWRWQIVNHYGCNLRQHRHKGRSRRIYRRAEMAYLHSQPDVTHAVGSHAENRILYFRSEEKYKRVVKRHGIGSGRYLLQRAGTYRHTFKPMGGGPKADIFQGDRHA